MKIFIISLVALVILVVLYVRKQKKSQQEHVYNYYRDKKIMNELTFPAFRYYVEDDCMKGNKHFQEISGRRSIEDFLKSGKTFIRNIILTGCFQKLIVSKRTAKWLRLNLYCS